VTSEPVPLVGDVLFQTGHGLIDSGFLWIAAGYAVRNGQVLLCLHNRFKKWVPPGGHVEPGETFSKAAAREFREETGMACDVVSSTETLHPPDGNSTPEASPFYSDIIRDGFRKPAIALYFYVTPNTWPATLESFQRNELDDMRLFSRSQLDTIDTFEQVRSLARYAIDHHPHPGGSD
jgi:8-oxo-dGTP pyrophosphatase MutT (NUDIX family)